MVCHLTRIVADVGRIHPRRNQEWAEANDKTEALQDSDASPSGVAPALPPRLSPIENLKLSIGRLHVCDRYAQVQKLCYPHLMLRENRYIRGEVRLARRQVCPLQVFHVCKRVADSGDLVIEKRDFATVDTHVPAISISLSPVLYVVLKPRRNRMLLRGPHLGARRFVSSDLHLIELATRRCGIMMHNEIHTPIVRGVHNSMPAETPRFIGYQWSREAGKLWRGEGGAGGSLDNARNSLSGVYILL